MRWVQRWGGAGPPMSALEPTPVANPRIWALPPVATRRPMAIGMFAGRKHDTPPVIRLRSGYRLILEPVAQSDPCQNPKLIMEFILVPPRRVPSEGEVLIELHQLASMKNARSKVVHLCAPFP